VRLFIAVNFPDSVRRAVADGARRVREAVSGVRWTSTEQLHITLKFLGECDERAADAVGGMLGVVCAHHRPFAVGIGGLGAFPNLQRPRVVWTAARDGGRLVALARDIERECEALGFAAEDRPFRPHLTLGRAKDGLSSAESDALAALAAQPERRVEAQVATVELMQSVLSGAGARHSVVASVPLGSLEGRE
jgi:2'-5' RNA ligase